MLWARHSPKLVAVLLVAMGAASVAPARATGPADCPNHGVLLDAAALCAMPQVVAVRADMSPTLRGRTTERGARMAVADSAAVTSEAERRRTDPAGDDAATARSTPTPRAATRQGDR